MAYGESKAKLGNRGKITGPKTFNTHSGTHKSKQDSAPAYHEDWAGTVSGNHKHKKGA